MVTISQFSRSLIVKFHQSSGALFVSRPGRGSGPHPFFQGSWYLAVNADVAKAGVNSLAHYVLTCAKEGRSPNPSFDVAVYLRSNPRVNESGLNPLLHRIGIKPDREGELT